MLGARQSGQIDASLASLNAGFVFPKSEILELTCCLGSPGMPTATADISVTTAGLLSKDIVKTISNDFTGACNHLYSPQCWLKLHPQLKSNGPDRGTALAAVSIWLHAQFPRKQQKRGQAEIEGMSLACWFAVERTSELVLQTAVSEYDMRVYIMYIYTMQMCT